CSSSESSRSASSRWGATGQSPSSTVTTVASSASSTGTPSTTGKRRRRPGPSQSCAHCSAGRPSSSTTSTSSCRPTGQRRISRTQGSYCGLAICVLLSYQPQDGVPDLLHGRGVGGLDVEPQQRLGVAGPEGEPPGRGLLP